MSERFYIAPQDFEELTDGIPDKKASAYRLAQNLNRALSLIQNRLDIIERVAVSVTGRIVSFSVEGRQGLFHLIWNRVDDADGYLIEMFSDSAATTRIGSWTALGSQTTQWQVTVGNVSVTRYFRITPFAGKVYGSPSALVGDSSDAYGVGESAPSNPPTNLGGPEDLFATGVL